MNGTSLTMPKPDLRGGTAIIGGLGGIGSLQSLLMAMAAKLLRIELVMVIDGDAYEKATGPTGRDDRARQVFAAFVEDDAGAAHLSKKVSVVAEMLQRGFGDTGVAFAGVPVFLTPDNALELLPRTGPLLALSGFDLHSSRRVLYEAVVARAQAAPEEWTILLQAGNTGLDEQDDFGRTASVAVYAQHGGLRVDGFRLHPEVLEADLSDLPSNEEAAHCFDLVAGGEQLLATNAQAASLTLQLLFECMQGRWFEEASATAVDFTMSALPARVLQVT